MSSNTEELEIIRLAKKCHEGWMAAKLADGYHYDAETNDKLKTNCNLLPWEQLSEEIRNSNINTARKSYELVQKTGARFIKISSLVTLLKRKSAKDIAKQLHMAWAEDKKANGWTYGEVTDKSKKIHRDLCVIEGVLTYDEFVKKYPEDAQYDFETAYAILDGDLEYVPVSETFLKGLLA